MKKTLFLIAATVCLACSLLGQAINGRGRALGHGRIVLVDNCTKYSAGETNAVTNTSKNYVKWWATRLDISDSFTFCKVGADLSKVGSPAGAVRVEIWSNGSNKPDTLLAQSAYFTNSLITVGVETNYFPISMSVTNGQVLWAVIHFTDSVGFGDLTDYFQVHAHFSVSGLDILYGSPDGSDWQDTGIRAFLIFQLIRAE